ncbi:MAG: glycosyltransferase family 2 protein [Dongiaceae bacterium]
MMKLTALIVAHNEQAHLAACLDTLLFADEIVVVLDKCTDGSKEIAARYTKNLIEGSWDLEGPRRHAGIAACQGEWILEVDADERITPALAAEIKQTIANPSGDYYLIPVDNYIGQRLVRHGWGGSFGTSAVRRLWKKGHKHWGNERVHPKVTFTGKEGVALKNPLIHYVDDTISDLWLRLDRYSTARARDLREGWKRGQKKESLARNIRRLFSRFIKCYCMRQGYREGGYGLLIALCAGLFPLLSYLKANLENE